MNASLRAELSRVDGATTLFDEPMSAHTTYKVGGPAAAFVEVETTYALSTVLSALEQHQTPWLVVGNGSNVLFADRGYGGCVLRLVGGFETARLERDQGGPGLHRLEAGAGLSITRLLRVAKEESISGVEYLGGVPGTVGGAVRMNAGTNAGEVADTLRSAELTDAAAGARWVDIGALGLSYRHSELPPGAVVTAARFDVVDADPGMRERLDTVLAYRKSTQPLTKPSCGSVFANPEGHHAGRLIEAAGLKGRSIGGAQVSEQHANSIINTGGATAEDVRSLIALCITEVRARFHIELRHEVQLLGDWEVLA